jgi:hypothetical protein
VAASRPRFCGDGWDGSRAAKSRPASSSTSRTAERLWTLPLPPKLSQARARHLAKGKPLTPLWVSEISLREGDAVEVLGYKNRIVDASLSERLERDTPMRATVRGGAKLPLLITPASG